jgi:hypothetical protein
VVIGAIKNSAYSDSDREFGYRDNLVFKPYTQCMSRSREGADRLFDAVAEHAEERLLQERGDAVRQLFGRWSKVLWAKKLLEEGRGRPIRYTGVRVEGRRVWLEVGRSASEELVGEPRVIRLGDRRSVRGEVEQVSDGSLALYVENSSLDDTPATGELQYDTDAAKTALARQESALNAVKHGTSLRADLRELLAKPAEARPPRIVDEPTFFHEDLDHSKRVAVRAALGLEDLIVVEGPPGTGKTTFIAELIAQFQACNPDRTSSFRRRRTRRWTTRWRRSTHSFPGCASCAWVVPNASRRSSITSGLTPSWRRGAARSWRRVRRS